jgi:hypothetical protein
VKLSTVVFILAAGLWIPGYLHYGWLLIQTVGSAINLWITVAFSIQFLFWLFSMVGVFALIIMEKLKVKDTRA